MARASSPEAGEARTRICVGQFGAAHGVRGEVRLKSFTADPLSLRAYGPLESEDGSRQFRITAMRPAKDMLIVRLEGIDGRTAAESLCNMRLFVPRERLPPPEEDEFYHADLIGLAAHDPAGTKLGTVVAVHNFGAGDLIELAPVGGGATVLLPFTKAVVPKVDVVAGRLEIEPPEGTFDEAERLAPRPSPLAGGGK